MIDQEIIGQKRVIDILDNSIRMNKLLHAYIFTGPEGIGKRTIAKKFMQAIMCENSDGINPCGKCKFCISYKVGIPVDYMIFENEENSLGVDEVRKIIKDAIIKPAYSNKKVYIIVDGDKLTRQAQNAFLKILEEPYEYVHIIITVSNIDLIIDTVRSRIVEINFDKYSSNEIRKYLTINRLCNETEMDSIIACSDGIIGKAKKLVKSDVFVTMRNEIINSALKIFNSNENNNEFKMVISKYFTSLDDTLNILQSIFRDMLVMSTNANEDMLINVDKKDIIIENSKKANISRIVRAQKAIEKANMKLKMNASKKIAIEAMFIEIMEREV